MTSRFSPLELPGTEPQAQPGRDSVTIRIEIGDDGARLCNATPDGRRLTEWVDLAYDEARVVLKTVRPTIERSRAL